MFYKICIYLAISIATLSSAHAATVYVSDIQFVAIRESQNNTSRAVERGLKSGTPLEILAQADGYTRVRTPSGNVGWIADYFLSEDMVSRDQLVSLQSQITQLTENRIQTQNQLDASIQLSETLKKDVTTLASEKMALEQRLSDLNELTQEAQRIVEQNANSTFAIASLEQRLQASEDATAKLQQSNEQKWFIIGAGTLFIGFLIGLLFSMTRKKKPNTGTWV